MTATWSSNDCLSFSSLVITKRKCTKITLTQNDGYNLSFGLINGRYKYRFSA